MIIYSIQKEKNLKNSNIQNSFLKSMFNVLKEVTNDIKGKKTPNKNLDNYQQTEAKTYSSKKNYKNSSIFKRK